MSIKKVIGLEVETNAEQVGNQFDNLNKSLDETAKTTNKLHEKFEDAYKGAEPLTTVLGEMEDKLYQMALAGEQNTEQFAELLKEVGKYRKTQIETDLAVDTAAQTMSAKLGGALQGAASGFALVQGAMGLFGTESEEVEQALLKVNSAMALADGIKGVQEFTKSFGLASKATKAFTVVQKALNLVLAANPFALMVTAVVGLIGYFAVFTDAINVVIESLQAVSDWLGITDSEAEENASKREREAEVQKQLQEQEQARQEQLHNSRMSALDREIAVAKANGKDTTKLQKQKINEEIALRKAAMATLLVEQEKLKVFKDQFTAMASQGGIRGKVGRAGLAAIAKSESNVLELEEEILKLENDLVILDIEFEKRRTASKKEKDETKKEQVKDLGRLKTLKLEEIKLEKDILDGKLVAQKEYYDKINKIAVKSGLTRKEVEQELSNASFQIASDTVNLVSELNSLFASENEEQAERSFKIDKAAKLASATIAGVQATIEAFKTASASPITIGFPAYPFVQAGLAGSFAAVNIAKIAKSKFQGGGGAGELDTGSAGGGAGASATPTAQFNVVGDSGINQLAELQNQKPTQAFVVSSEVTTAQSLDRNRVQNATL